MKLFILCLVLSNALFAEPLIVGIAGGTGSGKTTLARKIQEAFPQESVLISQDSYYKPLSNFPLKIREKMNFDHPDALDFALFRQHILDLKEGKSIEKPIYNFCTHTRDPGVEVVDSCELIIVEGILLFAVPEVRELFDIKLFVDTDDDVRLLRRIERDLHERGRTFESVRDQYLTTVKPMHDAFVEPSKQLADLIVPQGGENATALQLILSRLKEDITAKNRVALNHASDR